jgi:hypothetical protein
MLPDDLPRTSTRSSSPVLPTAIPVPSTTSSSLIFVPKQVTLRTSKVPDWLMAHLGVLQLLDIGGSLWEQLLATWIELERQFRFVQAGVSFTIM